MTRRNFVLLFKMLWKFNRLFFLYCFFIIVLQNIFNITNILLSKLLIDFLTENAIAKASITAIILCTAIFVFGAFLMYFNYKKRHILQKFHIELGAVLAMKSYSIPFEKYENFKVREEYQFAVKCANERSADKIIDYIVNTVSSVITFLSLLYIISYVVWWLWLIIILSVVINTICEAYQVKFNFESNQSQNAVEMRMLYARDRLTWKSFAKEVRLFGMYDYVVGVANKYIDALAAIQKERAKKTFQALWFSYLFNGVQMLAVYGFVGYKCFIGDFSVGEFTMLTLALLSIGQITSNVAASFIDVKGQGEYVDNYFKFICYDDVETGRKHVAKKDNFEIKFDQVRFAYSDGGEEALQGITYAFQSGKKYGIVGANGSGKTNFINLLMGLYSPSSGQILFDGHPIEEYSRSEYFSLFSPVLQDFNIYAYTVEENISMNKCPNPEKVDRLIHVMNLTERIGSLPSKTKTYVTTEYEDEGTEFSGGELQKLAIIRAMYKDAPIIVLDEPTSALSPRAEYELYSKLNEICANKTVFFISHRMASCRMCDEVLVFDHGKIVESGNHDSLMQLNGLYHRMFSAQASLYGEDDHEKV